MGRKTKKKMIYPLVSLAIISLIALSIITSTYGPNQILKAMRSYPPFFLVVAFFIYTLRWFVESLAFRISTGKYKQLTFSQCLKTVIVTQFTNMITPFMSGGQPATLFVLNRFGLDIASSFSAMFIKSMMYQFFLSLSGFVCLLITFNTLESIAKNAAITGIVINLGIVMGILTIGISESAAKKLISFIIGILRKVRVIKNNRETQQNIYENIKKFNNSFKEFRQEKKRLLFLFMMTGCQFTLFNLCAFVLLNGFGAFSTVNVFARLVLINSSALIVPTPGNSGGAEGLFAIFLNAILPDGIMGAGILIWRLIVFYLPVIILGVGTFFISIRLLNEKGINIQEESQ
ncbi:MAG: lysylphosphatidylglycerol synthase transmembrane domain-containing protein [Thermotogota bacterium]